MAAHPFEFLRVVVVDTCVSLLCRETINTMSNIFTASTEAAKIISAAGDTLSVPAPAVQHEESIKTGHPHIDEGKPKSAASGSLIIYIVVLQMICSSELFNT